eukprot:11056918-Alexandrium_andersonii.AAC.1
MSASLVGSEMCIRDSLSCARSRRKSATPRFRRCAPGRGRRAVHALAPVSYTHLTLPTICSV